jgi:hypothetical protein
VEGVFSSSKCASISQMCKSVPPRAGHLLFITFHSRASRYQLHLTIFGGDRRCTVASVAKPTDATGASVAPPSSHVSRSLEVHRVCRTTEQPRVAPPIDVALPPSDAVQKPCFHAEPSDAYATRMTDAVMSVCRSHSHVPTHFHSVRHVCRDRQTRHREAVCAPDHQTRPVLSRVTCLSCYAAPRIKRLSCNTR